MSFLELEQLDKVFADGTHAVKGIDMAAAKGELVVLLGPSGCGKTTTLRMIAGLERPTRGSVTIEQTNVTALKPAQRDVGFVFQFYALYPHLKVRENIAFPLKSTGMPRAERAAVMDKVVLKLGIGHLLDRYPPQLSGGDQQRIALARAMVRRPAVFLMDEPLGTLDADMRLEMREFIRSHQIEEQDRTVYVTHDQEEAMSLADRIVVMDEGLICQVGTPTEVYDNPSSLFVANFVGSPGMNLIDGEIVRKNGAAIFRAGDGAIGLRGPREPGKCTLGIRPEYVHVVSQDGTVPVLLSGTIVASEYLGSWRCIHADTPMGRVIARADTHHLCPVGTTVVLTFDEAHVCLFDTARGTRL